MGLNKAPSVGKRNTAFAEYLRSFRSRNKKFPKDIPIYSQRKIDQTTSKRSIGLYQQWKLFRLGTLGIALN